MATAPTITGRAWGLLVLLSVLWGGAYFLAGVAVREVPPLTVVFLRVALAALTMLVICRALGHRLPRGAGAWVPFIGMGVLNNVLPFSFIFAGQTYVGVGLSSIINAMTPLFTVLILAGAGDERLTAGRLAGVVLGLAGVAILQGVDGADAAQTTGILLCMAGAVSYGFAALWARRRLAGVAPLTAATCQLIASSVIMAAIAGVYDRPWDLATPSAGALGSVVALAIFGTAIAYLVFFRIVELAGAGNVMLVTLLIPVTAVALGALFLDERLGVQEIAGALVIGCGLLAIDGRVPRWLAARIGLAARG